MLDLVIDASTLVAELFRQRGRRLIAHPLLNLTVPGPILVEAQYELSKRTTLRVKRGIVTAEEAEAILQQAADDVARHVHVLGLDDYAAGLAEARWRLPRDPNDVPVLALALTLNWGIWTADYDFFGCGAAVWSTEVLLEYVTRATPAA